MPTKKTKARMTPESVAEKAKPNWKAIEQGISDRAAKSKPEASSPELDQLRRKYLGENAVADASRTKSKSNKSDTKIVVMEEKNPSDVKVGRKAVVVEKGKVIAEQG